MTSCSTLSERKASSAPAKLPSAFNRLAWSNLAAQSAEQIGLAGATGVLQTAQTLPFLLIRRCS